jgi:uncharacterized cupredoxin-like copper-binding protein
MMFVRSRQPFGAIVVIGLMFATGVTGVSAHQEAVHPAAIYRGNCTTLGAAVAPLNAVGSPAALDDATGTPPPPVGQVNPVETDVSVTTVHLTLSELTAGQYAIDVRRSADDPGNRIACGEIGGTPTGDGSLAVALRDVSHSLESGIAYVHDNEDGTTTVTLMTVQHPEPNSSTTQPVAAVQNGVDITLADMVIQPEATTFKVGVPYTFVITNHGASIHEFVIEHAGDVDKPIEFSGGVAEAADIIPGSTATMTFTFTAPGKYQFACHQPGHFEAGMVAQVDVSA